MYPAGKTVAKLLSHLIEYGPADTATLVRKNLASKAREFLNRRWDRRFHVSTTGVVQLDELTCTGATASAIWYEPTPIRTLRQMARFLPPDLNGFTFVDFGSGKGRTLLQASCLNFDSVIGVEFARELYEIAELNINTFRSAKQRCFDVHSVCMDAADFRIPAGNCVFYFWLSARIIRCRILCGFLDF